MVPDDDKVCIVAASTAWPFYRLTGAYVCQENRYIQEDSGRLGFYSARLIHGAAPVIESIYPSIALHDRAVAEMAFDSNPEVRRVGMVAEAALADGTVDLLVQIVLLTPIEDPRTVTFEPVRHDGKSAWTMRQRYARLSQLTLARTTNDLTVEDKES